MQLKFRWPIQKFLCAPNFPVSSCGTLETRCSAHVKDHWFRRLPFSLLMKGWIFYLLSYSDSSAAHLPAQDVPHFFRLSLLLRSRMFGSLISSPTRVTVPWSVSTGILWQFDFVKNNYSHKRFIVYIKKPYFLTQVCLFVSYKYCNICHIQVVHSPKNALFISLVKSFKFTLNIQ